MKQLEESLKYFKNNNKNMQTTIVIPTLKDNIEYLKTTIKSIKKYAKEDHEIIVVTNNGPAFYIPIQGIKVYHTETQGQGGAVNLGIKAASNEYIYVSDDDVVFPPNFEELTEKAKEVDFLSGNFMENESKGGAAAPFIKHDCGNTYKDFNWEEFEKSSMEMKEDVWENGFGFPLLFKKSLWEKIEGYDIEYDPWGSNIESDLEYKIMLSGIMPRRWRGAVTYHFAQVSGTFIKPEALPFWDKNRGYFERKWGIARAGAPEIWMCDFKINGTNLIYKPEWAKLEDNQNIVYE